MDHSYKQYMTLHDNNIIHTQFYASCHGQLQTLYSNQVAPILRSFNTRVCAKAKKYMFNLSIFKNQAWNNKMNTHFAVCLNANTLLHISHFSAFRELLHLHALYVMHLFIIPGEALRTMAFVIDFPSHDAWMIAFIYMN